jgi:hypothetical protein
VKFLTPIGLAYWCQDDGYLLGSGVGIITQNYTKSENLLLIKTLKYKINLDCTT